MPRAEKDELIAITVRVSPQEIEQVEAYGKKHGLDSRAKSMWHAFLRAENGGDVALGSSPRDALNFLGTRDFVKIYKQLGIAR